MARAASTKRYRVSLLGLGAMGQRHARVLGSLPDRFEQVGAYDPRGDATTPVGIERVTSEEEAIRRADVVVVATPVETHAQLAARALASGRHVLVEKPLCATGAEAHALSASARGGLRVFVGHTERFNPVVRALARLVKAARGDAVSSIELRRVGRSRPSSCGALVNLAVHDFDLAAYLAGSEVKLRAALGGRSAGGFDEDFAHCLFAAAVGAVGHLFVDRTAPDPQRTLIVSTARWVYEGDLLAHRLVRTPRPGGPKADVPLSMDEPLVSQAIALADSLSGVAVREIATALDGARAVALAEEASRMCRENTVAESFGRRA